MAFDRFRGKDRCHSATVRTGQTVGPLALSKFKTGRPGVVGMIALVDLAALSGDLAQKLRIETSECRSTFIEEARKFMDFFARVVGWQSSQSVNIGTAKINHADIERRPVGTEGSEDLAGSLLEDDWLKIEHGGVCGEFGGDS